MKVVKYEFKASIINQGGKEEIITRNFRHLVNARKFIKELKLKYDLSCGNLTTKDDTYITECKNEKVVVKIEIKRIRLKKKKEDKTEQKQNQ
ncbi:MAG: hypothetical protein QXV69_04875 [Sulfolobaceae archaeon]